jgi:hypothetical protein
VAVSGGVVHCDCVGGLVESPPPPPSTDPPVRYICHLCTVYLIGSNLIERYSDEYRYSYLLYRRFGCIVSFMSFKMIAVGVPQYISDQCVDESVV